MKDKGFISNVRSKFFIDIPFDKHGLICVRFTYHNLTL